MPSLATLTMEITADSSQVEQALARTNAAIDSASAKAKSAGSSFASMGQTLNSVGATMSLAFTAPLAAIGVASINAASDVSEAMSAVNTVFGDSAGIITEFAAGSAANLGITEGAALSAAGRLGALGSGLGFVGDDLANFSVDIIGAATDLSSFYNVDQATALDALRAGLVGEAEPLRQFGILLDAASVESQAMAMGLAESTDALTQQDLVMARQALILDQLGAAQGDFARTSDGLANSQRILMAEFGNLSAELGAVLLPIALQVVSAMLDFVPVISQMITGFQSLPPGIQTSVLAFVGLVGALGPVLLITGQVISAISTLAPLFAVLTGPIGLLILALGALFVAYQTNFLGFADGVNAAAAIVGEALNNLVALFGNMVAAFQDGGLTAALGVLGEAFTTAFTNISTTVQTGLQAISDALATWLSEQGANFAAGLLAMQEAASSAWITIQNDIAARLDGINVKMTEVWEGIQTFLGEKLEAIQSTISTTWDTIQTTVSTALATVQTTISTAWESIQSGALTAMSELLATIRATFDLIAADVGTKVEAMKTGLLNTLTTMKDEALTTITGLKDGILGVFADAGSWLLQAGKDIIQGLIDGIMSMAGEVGNAISSVIPSDITISNPFTNPFDQGGGGGNPNFRGRAHGGPVLADTAYWVGEQGPELFMPGRSGFVVPHGQSMALAGSGGDTIVHNHFDRGSVVLQDGEDWDRFFSDKQSSREVAASRRVS